ncbi:hypothetical protein PVK06_049450 [Gossypium arboreum]|uniref:DNA helicase n=1 Tax=Gossypium arboreum TaxID=29729 RepID=A0ABR0MJA7_GOSAR|nr:hypothetical protein PVK06_049450 [Gossypium arboreum]
MSGWDEGAVYYSNQAQFTEASSEAEAAAASTTASRHSVLLKFKEFIRNFEKEKNVFPYRESLVNNPKFLMVHLEDLLSFDSDLPSLLRSSPSDYLPLFETAAAEVLAGLKMKVAGDSGEMVEPQTGEVQILLTSKEDPVSMRSLGAQYISKLVKISGITIAASRIKAKATYVHLICKNCKSARAVPCRPGLGGAIVPRSCDHVPQPGEEPCPIDPWLIVPDKSKYVDQQTLKLQENPEDVPTGELPRNMLLSVDRHLVQTIVPGSRLTIMGIYSIFQASNSSTNHKGAVAVRQPYIRIVGMEETNEASSRGPATFTQEEVEEFKKFASNQDTYEAICSKVAPSIFGHEDVKKAVACLLFGGARKNLPDGVKLRGDINVLLLGDPSTAKSQFLKFVEKTAPIAVYTSGKGSSAAGLTASVIRDSSSREFYLEGGAMVLADGGVVCIDEFDKMRPEDRVAIHEAMEQQTISIAKAGITTVLNSRTSVLAAANPPSGRYDDLKTAQDNIDLQTTILSRFDLIFIVKDIRMYDQDKTIASHIIKVHASAQTVSNDSGTSKEENWLKRYIQYCRSECHPRLSEAACAKLQSDYVDIRRGMRQQANETGESAAIPITVRQLEAILRLSEALAKMKLSHVATEGDVAEALRLFKVSTMDAARSGINQHINITPDMANEIKQAENQIKRRLGIGNRISERRLIDDLTRMGMNESIVRRAILIMHQRGQQFYCKIKFQIPVVVVVLIMNDRTNKNLCNVMLYAVLGAGFAGLSVAWHLLKESPKDLNLHIDLYDEMGIGGGASGVSGGLLHPYSPKVKLLWSGAECWKECMKLLSIAEQAVSSEEDFVSLSGEFDQDFGGILDRRRGIIRPATNMNTLNVLNDNAKNCLANCKIEIIDKNAAEKLVPHIHMPFNLAFYMPEAINVNSKYYLNALFLACQNIVKELSASGFGKKNLCLQKKSVNELRELEGEYDAVIICLGAKADLLPELAGKLPLRTSRGVILHLQLPDNIGEDYPDHGPSILSDAWLAIKGNRSLYLGSTWEWKSRNSSSNVSTDEASDALQELLPKASAIYPGITSWSFAGARAGLRAMPPLTPHGSLPLLGCVNNILGNDLKCKYWLLGGLGSRGLLYHGWLGKLTAEAVLSCNEQIIPSELTSWKNKDSRP